MIQSFFKYIEFEKRYSKHTLISYRNDLLQFSSYLESTYQLDNPQEANYGIIRSWILSLVEDNISPKSINRKLACLRSYYKFLLKRGDISKDPMLKIKAPKVKKSLPSFIEEESIHKLLDQVEFKNDFQGIRDKLVLEILYGTGIRLSELINLKESDVNFSERTIKVLGKGNKQRIIPLNQTLFQLIDIYRKSKKSEMGSGDYLIITDNGKKAYPMFIYRIVRNYLSIITSLEKRSPHVLRHSFATHLLNKGADLNAIKDLLGHSSLAATQVYTHNSIEKLKSIFDQAHPKS
jgi:integrase/recombinase XerC